MNRSYTRTSVLLLIGALLVGVIAIGQTLSFAWASRESKPDRNEVPIIVEDAGSSESKGSKKDDKKSKKEKDSDTATTSGKKTSDEKTDSSAGTAQSQRSDGRGSGSQDTSGTSRGGSSSSNSGSNSSSSSTNNGSPSDDGSNVTPAYPSGSTVYGNGSPQKLADANKAQKAIVEAAKSTPATPDGYSALWVEDVIDNAGHGRYEGNSCDLYDLYCASSDLSSLKVGMIVAVSSHPHTKDGSTWGHTGIYIGDGQVMDCVGGRVRTQSLSEWMDYYGVTVPIRWGWLGDINLA